MHNPKTPIDAMTPEKRAVAEQYVQKLARWEALLRLGKPGLRQLRAQIRAEAIPFKTALMQDDMRRRAPQETTP